MAFVEVNPRYRELLARLGLRAPQDFLSRAPRKGRQRETEAHHAQVQERMPVFDRRAMAAIVPSAAR